jgi:hypothetical protein
MQRTLMFVFGGLTAVAFVALAGCGGGKRWTFNNKVEGTIKLDGTPLAGVVVEFVPEDDQSQGPTSRGYTNENGQFRLRADGRKPGAVIGKHAVVLLIGRGGDVQAGEDQGKEADAIAKARRKNPPVPTPYKTVRETPLAVEVTADEHNYDLNLTSRVAPRPVKKR